MAQWQRGQSPAATLKQKATGPPEIHHQDISPPAEQPKGCSPSHKQQEQGQKHTQRQQGGRQEVQVACAPQKRQEQGQRAGQQQQQQQQQLLHQQQQQQKDGVTKHTPSDGCASCVEFTRQLLAAQQQCQALSLEVDRYGGGKAVVILEVWGKFGVWGIRVMGLGVGGCGCVYVGVGMKGVRAQLGACLFGEGHAHTAWSVSIW